MGGGGCLTVQCYAACITSVQCYAASMYCQVMPVAAKVNIHQWPPPSPSPLKQAPQLTLTPTPTLPGKR